MKEKRGFEKLKGLQIKTVYQDTINVVAIKTACGRVFEIAADEIHHGIPVLTCTENVTGPAKKELKAPKPVDIGSDLLLLRGLIEARKMYRWFPGEVNELIETNKLTVPTVQNKMKRDTRYLWYREELYHIIDTALKVKT